MRTFGLVIALVILVVTSYEFSIFRDHDVDFALEKKKKEKFGFSFSLVSSCNFESIWPAFLNLVLRSWFSLFPRELHCSIVVSILAGLEFRFSYPGVFVLLASLVLVPAATFYFCLPESMVPLVLSSRVCT